MKKDIQKIADEIKDLLDQLVVMATTQKKGAQRIQKTKTETMPKGASGAISMLVEEGFFDSPKNLSTVMKKLKEIGRYYSKASVAMNLLNLTKRRVFSRFKNKETKNWEYTVRK